MQYISVKHVLHATRLCALMYYVGTHVLREKIGVFMYYIGTYVIHKPFMHYVIQATLMYYIRFVM